MRKKVISVAHLYKQYRLGLVSTGTLAHDLNRWWHRMRGQEDPYEKVTGSNKRDEKGDSEYVWALEDISFDVYQGDVLGIVGKNGAGKSTLLKILSKVTGPSKGSIKFNGRIASLLEVGTGFHPELTGRENIYLNGAILGMTKNEIRSKFDEIVAFSGVEKYIDTPVKRYSSGMYVRLAFAVAAHLEPEILIVDEVLAVGDAEFQKKCLGKMKDVSGQGRTVLFVSHNMTAVKSLCTSGILMKQGRVAFSGTADEVVNEYIRSNTEQIRQHVVFDSHENAPGNEFVRIKEIGVTPADIDLEDDIEINIAYRSFLDEDKIRVAFDLINIHEQTVLSTGTLANADKGKDSLVRCTIPGNLLNDSIYNLHIYFFTEGMKPLYNLSEAVQFEVKEKERDYAYFGKVNGVIRPVLKWENPIS